MTDYYPHDPVESDLAAPTVSDELAVFGASGSLVSAVRDFGEAQGYTVYVLKPGDDVLKNLLFATANRGMGNWTANVKNAFEIPSGTTDVRVPGALAVQINKVGAGVQLPQFVLYVQLSKILYR